MLTLLLCALASLAVAQNGQASLSKAATILELDAGQRWVVDAAMMAHLGAMESDLRDFRGERRQDYQELAGRLQKRLGSLVAGCTMEGKAHDELHKWLVPFMAEVQAFADTEDLKSLQARHRALKDSFETFRAYFR
jgi:hypothetical protein